MAHNEDEVLDENEVETAVYDDEYLDDAEEQSEGEISEDAPLLSGDLEKVDEKKRAAIRLQFNVHRTKLANLERMTDNPAWRDIWSHIDGQINRHSEEVLVIDQSSKEIIGHQQGVRLFRDLQEYIRKPIDDYHYFRDQHATTLYDLGLGVKTDFNSDEGTLRVEDLYTDRD